MCDTLDRRNEGAFEALDRSYSNFRMRESLPNVNFFLNGGLLPNPY